MKIISQAQLAYELPNLCEPLYRETSEYDPVYNCIAWAAGDTENWWWPGGHPDDYWPAGVPSELTIDAFVAAYATLGYVRCEEATFEKSFERIAIYGNVTGGTVTPTHAARQLPNGCWTSKLGKHEDIEHSTAACVEGGTYGSIVCFMKRPVAP
jgi:hypothetical protein